jgi:predicted ribosomally synthesized peptide with SipW-like signal peptide
MSDRRENRRRGPFAWLGGGRWRAVLASGLVLGVGSFITLAAWTDTENATGTFAASIFDTQSQSAGSPTYASNTTAPGATLSFAATGMSPGVSSYAWLNVRTTPETTVGGTLTLTAATSSGGLAPALEYRAVRLASPNPTSTCTAASFTGSPVFVAGGASSYIPVTTVPGSPVSNTLTSAGGALGFCFEVRIGTAAASTFQGLNATTTWTFSAVSG